MRLFFAVALLSGLGVMVFGAAPAGAFATSPLCRGSFGYGSDGKKHCDVAQFEADKKAGRKYKYDPSKAGSHKDQKNK
jgi:hypothetical protein